MACVPGRLQTNAFFTLMRDKRNDVAYHYGKSWAIENIITENEGVCKGVWRLWHYGVCVLEVVAIDNKETVKIGGCSNSDRDGINGLLILLGLDDKYKARMVKGKLILQELKK